MSNSTISFTPLTSSSFPLLLKWLSNPHVKNWWDGDIDWTLELIQEKYSSYVQGFKLQNGKQKAIRAFVIYSHAEPVGYIQIYNAYDFPRAHRLEDLPESLASFDMFIGEESALGKGIGSEALRMFLDEFCDKDYVFADPERDNIAAIKTYEKVGFKRIKDVDNEIWMLRDFYRDDELTESLQMTGNNISQ